MGTNVGDSGGRLGAVHQQMGSRDVGVRSPAVALLASGHLLCGAGHTRTEV